MTAQRAQPKLRLVLAVALCVLVGLVCAWVSVDGRPSSLLRSAATARAMIDTPKATLIDRKLLPQDYDAMVKRAELYGRVMASPPVIGLIARRLHVPAGKIAGQGRVTAPVPHALTEPDSEQRAAEILHFGFPYRFEVEASPGFPLLTVYAEAPTTAGARALADAAIAGLRQYLVQLAAQQRFPQRHLVVLRQLGAARGAVVNSRAPMAIAVLSFLVGAGIVGLLIAIVVALQRRGRREADPERTASWRREAARRLADSRLDDWPHTTRLLPWSLALFLVVLWLMPFNQIKLNVSAPIDLDLDRLVLPLVAIAWVLALLAGGRMAPRLRLTWIHAAVGAFVVLAFLSVVVDARYLNQTLELDQSLKRLPLLVTYVSLFFFVSSSLRRSEIRAFLSFTLGLAVICALGVIWEYRFKYNVFYDMSQKLLPGFFSVETVDAANFDDLGRQMVRGPAAVPLEVVAMLAMALPIALVWLMQAKAWGERVKYGLFACLLLAAMFATSRKSALLIPVSVVITLAYFRRRELLRLSPMVLVLVVAVHVLSPGALGSTTSQLDASRLGVATVSDRAVDYDAVRPDVWSHLLVGRGWGSYDHINYRILDSEILQRTIEMGVIGLLAYLSMGVAVILSARSWIASRDPEIAPLALIGAAAAVAFLVASALFDILSFPHDTYIFLCMAGFVTVLIAPLRAPEPAPVEAGDAADDDALRELLGATG